MTVAENRQKPGVFYKNIQKIELLADVRKNKLKQIKLKLLVDDLNSETIKELDAIFKSHPGEVNVRFQVVSVKSGENLELKNKNLNIEVTNDLIRNIERLNNIELIPITQ